jgi:hypothetical protein
MSSVIHKSAAVVLWPVLNPDWRESKAIWESKSSTIWSCNSISKVFDSAGRILIGLKSSGFNGSAILGMGIILEFFHAVGKIPEIIIIKLNQQISGLNLAHQ